MPHTNYGQSETSYDRPNVYTGGGLRERLREQAQAAWNSPEGEAQRRALQDAGRRTAGRAYWEAARRVNLGRAFADAANRAGVSNAYRAAWGSPVF